MIALNGQQGELRMTLQITRKATGKVEEIELVGFVDENKLKENYFGGNSLNSGEKRSD